MKMSKNFVFPSFHFYPKELVTESKRIEEKYKDYDDQLIGKLSIIKLPELLRAIRKLKNERSVIIEYAKTLKKLDIKILTYEYPYQDEDIETLSKVIIILNERYSRIVGRRFWTHFHLQPTDENIHSLLDKAFTQEDNTFLSLEERVRTAYNHLFKSNKVLNKLAFLIGSEKLPLNEAFKLWNIQKDTKLEAFLWWLILKEFIGEKWFIQKESMDEIRKRIYSLSDRRYKVLLKSYLNAYEFDDFDNLLLSDAINRLRDPRVSKQRWDTFTESEIDKVIRWLYKKELISFFEKDTKYDRFKYWKKHIRYIQKLNLIDSPPIAAMYFGEFVVVEFAETGNAAYFYKTEGFDKYMSKNLKKGIYESILKDKQADFFITKLNHTTTQYNPEYWHGRFDEYMNQFYNHNFDYKHKQRW